MPDNDVMPIGELSRRSGVSTGLLRMWERRYGIPSPDRTPGGRRVYTGADERRVHEMRLRIEEGYSASVAARLVDAAEAGPHPDDVVGELRGELTHALDRFDESGANAVLDRVLARFSVTAALAEVVLPYLRELGARWEADRVSIAQEHFATVILRGRLLSLARNWGTGVGPRALLACPPGEHHDLGLICFGLGLREGGWRVTLLGPNTPGATIAEAAEALGPELVVVAAMEEPLLEAAAGELRALARRHALVLAGPGATAALAARTGARVLSGDPMAAARELPAGAG